MGWRTRAVFGLLDVPIEAQYVRDLYTGPGFEGVHGGGWYITKVSRTRTGSDPAEAIQLFKEAWQPVLDLGTKVEVVADVPAMDDAAIECVNRIGFDTATADCRTQADRALSHTDVLLEAAQGLDGVTVIDMNDLLCADGKCPMVIGGTVVYGRGRTSSTRGPTDRTPGWSVTPSPAECRC